MTKTMRRILPLFFTLSALGCSSDPPADSGGGSGTSGQGGGAGMTTTGGSAGTNTGGSAGTGMGGSVTGGSGGAGSSSGGSGGGGGSGWTKTGSCRQAGKAVAMGSTSYVGTEDFYILTEEAIDNGEIAPVPANLVCHIRFDVARSGDGAAGCADLDGLACEWSQEVEFSSPETILDVNGACATNEAKWDSAWQATIVGSRASYGFVDMIEGHTSVVMRQITAASGWQVLGTAYWDPMTGDLGYEGVLGDCQY
jgi:hypothetical protein